MSILKLKNIPNIKKKLKKTLLFKKQNGKPYFVICCKKS